MNTAPNATAPLPITDEDSPILLPPGTYLIEVAFARPLDSKTLADGLTRIGFSDGDGGPAAVDVSIGDKPTPGEYPAEAAERLSVLETHYREWTDVPTHPHRFRFVGTVAEMIVLQDTPDVVWSRIGKVGFDPFRDIRSTMLPYPLENQAAYDVRFISRMKAHATRHRVLEALTIMGFRPVGLACLKKNIRLAGRSGTDCALWCGRVVWEGPKTVLTVEDPFSFEDVVEVKDDESADTSPPASLVDPPGDVPDRVPGSRGSEPGGGIARTHANMADG